MRHFGDTEGTILLPMKFFGTVDYYASMGAYSRVVIDDTARYDKRQKDTHRMTVVDTHGIKQLTVPVSRPDNHVAPLRWSDIAISRHGQWWHVMAETLASAYGRTPFYEFYIDRFRPYFCTGTPDRYPDVATLCREADRAVRAILGFDNDIVYASETSPGVVGMHPGASAALLRVDYYQVRQDKFGFIPGLSILDLLFNMGTESALIIHRMIQ